MQTLRKTLGDYIAEQCRNTDAPGWDRLYELHSDEYYENYAADNYDEISLRRDFGHTVFTSAAGYKEFQDMWEISVN